MKIMRYLVSVVISVVPVTCLAQNYPSKPIRVVVPFAPGGTTDTIMRLLSTSLHEKLGQQVVVDNRPGAGGNIAANIVAKANPDGYTLFLSSMGISTINVHLYREMTFDPIKDFSPISLVAATTTVLAARPSLKVSSVGDLVEMAKRQPGKLTYSSGGVGSLNHVAGMLFEMLARIKLVHVPYKGGGPAVVAAIGSEVDLIFATIAPALPVIKSGRLNALAVGGVSRHRLMPEIPTMQESGVSEFEINSWYGIVVPAKTPRSVMTKLYETFTDIINAPETQKRLMNAGLDPLQGTPADFERLLRVDSLRWTKVLKGGGIEAR